MMGGTSSNTRVTAPNPSLRSTSPKPTNVKSTYTTENPFIGDHVKELLVFIPLELVQLCLQMAGPDISHIQLTINTSVYSPPRALKKLILQIPKHSSLITPPLRIRDADIPIFPENSQSELHYHNLTWNQGEHPHWESQLESFDRLLQEAVADWSSTHLMHNEYTDAIDHPTYDPVSSLTRTFRQRTAEQIKQPPVCFLRVRCRNPQCKSMPPQQRFRYVVRISITSILMDRTPVPLINLDQILQIVRIERPPPIVDFATDDQFHLNDE